MNKIKAILLIITVSLLMTACKDKEKNKLDNRVIDYWNYKINQDFKQAYEFLSPGWRKTESLQAYVARMRVVSIKWLGVKIKSKECTEKYLCTVLTDLQYEYQFRGAMSSTVQVTTELKEKWLMKNNIWYKVPGSLNVLKK